MQATGLARSTSTTPEHADFGVVLVVDDDPAWADACCTMIESMGYVTAKAVTIPEAFEQLAIHDVSTIIVDYRMPGGDGISLIYAMSGRSALHRRKVHFVLATAYPSLDVAVSAIRASVVDLLEKPFTAAALNATLLRIRSLGWQPEAAGSLSSQLATLSNEMRKIGSLVEAGTVSKDKSAPYYEQGNKEVDADLIRKLIRAEHSRSRVIGGKLLGDPAWNILLDLLLASIENRRVAVSSACIVAGVATTTALRLINRMVDDGVLIRVPDANDGRRHFLAIEPTVESALKNYLVDLSRL
jgi:CheY-like chemotaxis protein